MCGGKVVPADRSGGLHGQGVCQRGADVGFGIEEGPNRPFVRVVGAGRIARRRSDAAVRLGNEFVGRKRLIGRIAPVAGAHLGMEPFGQGFRQPVCHGFDQDGRKVIPGSGEFCRPFFRTVDGHGKGPDVIVCRRDAIGE